MKIGQCLIPLIALLAAACTSPQPLEVTNYILRDSFFGSEAADPLIRNEKLRRLHGAVSVEERQQLVGNYFKFDWHHPEGRDQAPATLTLEYQQSATASKVHTITRNFPADASSGTAEISITGEDYLRNGRILAWRATLKRGENTIASRQSYLWQ